MKQKYIPISEAAEKCDISPRQVQNLCRAGSVPDAVRFGRISYDKMLKLIENGAQVLHDRCVVLARAYQIPIEVLSAFTGAPGTIVG